MNEERINFYVCEFGHATVTVDVDEGCTPFMIGCKHEGCGQSSESCFYPRGVSLLKGLQVNGQPKWEWFKPDGLALHKKYGSDPDLLRAMIDHVKSGGLDLRARTDRHALRHK